MEEKRPDFLAVVLGHAIVGVGVGWVTAKLFKATTPGIVFGIAALVAHARFDAPVSQVLSDFGI